MRNREQEQEKEEMCHVQKITKKTENVFLKSVIFWGKLYDSSDRLFLGISSLSFIILRNESSLENLKEERPSVTDLTNVW